MNAHVSQSILSTIQIFPLTSRAKPSDDENRLGWNYIRDRNQYFPRDEKEKNYLKKFLNENKIK